MRTIYLLISTMVVILAGVTGCGSNVAPAPSALPAVTSALPIASPTVIFATPQAPPTAIPQTSATNTAAPVPVVAVALDQAASRGTIKMASFSFSPSVVMARVGQPVRLTLDNGDNIFHQFEIDNSDVDVQVGPGMSQKVDFVFSKPGTYVFACNLTEEGNHRGSGMVGTIVVGP
jgi:plastocyanin